MNRKNGLLSVALGGTFLFGGILLSAGTAQARDNCYEKIRREEFKLNREVRQHGFYSHQAENRRNKIRRLRNDCRVDGFRHRRDDGRWWGRRNHRDWDDDRRDRRHRRDEGYFRYRWGHRR